MKSVFYQSGAVRESDWLLIARLLNDALGNTAFLDEVGKDTSERLGDLATRLGDPASNLIEVDGDDEEDADEEDADDENE